MRKRQLFSKPRAPVYVLPGNKDERTNLRAAFSRKRYFVPNHAFIDYAIEDYPVRLIALDTLSPGHGRGDFRREQAEHLHALIDAEPNNPIAVFTHHPPFEVPVGPDRFHFESMEGMARLCEVLQRCTRLIGIFSGHVHRAASGKIGRIPASVVPCIATTLRKGEYPAHMKTRPIYHLHRYDPAWGFITESRVVGIEGLVTRDSAPASIATAAAD